MTYRNHDSTLRVPNVIVDVIDDLQTGVSPCTYMRIYICEHMDFANGFPRENVQTCCAAVVDKLIFPHFLGTVV